MDILEFINALKQKTGDDYFMHLEKLKSSPELIQETIDVLELKSDSDLANAICEALFVLYTDVGNESHKVCLQFIPAVIWAYYCQLSQKARGKPEALLLAFYNKCVTRNVETPFTNSFRIPKLSKPSVFHEPMQLAASATLTENALNQHDKSNKTIIFKGPTKRLDHIPSGMRNTVIATVLQEFNFSLSSYTKPTLLSLCHLVFRLSICGYKRPEVSCPGISKENISSLFNKMKVRLSAKCVQELVTALQFTSYNGLYEESKIVLDCLHQHSHYSLLYAGTLNTSALKNVLELSTSDKDFDVCPPIDPRKCGYRVKGGKTSVMTPPRPSFVNSLSIDRTMEDSNASITQTKSIASPSNVTIHIKTSSSNKTTVTAIPSIEIVSEGTDKTDGKNDIENGHTPNKRSSTYTDEDSEFENDKTPLIYCNSLSSDGSTTVVVLKSNPSSSPTSEKGQHEETPM